MDAVEKLGDEIGELAAHLDSATQRLLARIRAFDEADGWERQGAISSAHWLAWRIGLDTATARERVRVARALGALPKLDQALARGELSYAKVRALTRVATPALEERLLELAKYSTAAQLERICRGYRQVMLAEEDQTAVAEERSVRERVLPSGMVRIEMVLCSDEAALVMQALEKARDTLRTDLPGSPVSGPESGPDVSAERPVVSPARPEPEPVVSRADAAVFMAHSFLSPGTGEARGGGGDRYQVLVHLDQDVLAPDVQWAATLDDGTHVSAEGLRRICCDAGLVPTVTGLASATAGAAGEASAESPLNIGRRTRSIPPAIRRALWIRDRGCRFPGCPHRRFLHGHHIQHWLHGGATRLDNLVLLCPRHHALVHEGGFAVETARDLGLVFRAPTGESIAPVPPGAVVEAASEDLLKSAQARGISIDSSTNMSWWDGAEPDYDWAVGSLLPT